MPNEIKLMRINYPEDMQKIAEEYGYPHIYDMVQAEFRKGVAISAISKMVGWGHAHVAKVLYALGEKKRPWGGKRWSKVPPEIVEEIKALDKMPPSLTKKYAERFKCTRHTIRNIFNQTPGRIDGRLKRC